MLLSTVVPVYREEKNIAEFLRRVQPILEAITSDYEIIFALDPSSDRSEEIILEQRAEDPRIKLLRFSRRFGQAMALIAGMQYSSGDAVIVMDVDLQDPPEIINTMVEKWREGFDVVLPQRRHRTGEPWSKKLVTAVGYRIINRLADVKIPQNVGDFRLMSRRVVNEVVRLKECHGFLRGLVALVGFRQCIIPFDRPPRFAGRTKYNRFFGSARIGLDGIFCFSTHALTLSSLSGLVITGVSLLLAAVRLAYKLMGWPFFLRNPALAILILFLAGIQLLSVGILGEYIRRIYEEVRQRPKFIVDRAEGFGSGKPE
jgi:polyisoprenyl-phosphate glycosyltransferase